MYAYTPQIQHYNRDAPREKREAAARYERVDHLTYTPSSLFSQFKPRQARVTESFSYDNYKKFSNLYRGEGTLLLYARDQTLLVSLKVDVHVNTGLQVQEELLVSGHAPYTIQGLLRTSLTASYSQPTVIGFGKGDYYGYTVTAPRIYYELTPIPDPSGALSTNDVLYHTTMLKTGTVDSAFLVMTTNEDKEPLDGAPDSEALRTKTPASLSADRIANSGADLAVWVKLPVGRLPSDVVRLTIENTVEEGRLMAYSPIYFTVQTATTVQENAAMSAFRKKAVALGYTVKDHITVEQNETSNDTP